MKNTSRLAFILPPDWFSVQWSLKIKENVVGSKSSHPIFRKKPWRLSEALGFSTTSRMLLMFFSASWKTYSQILRSCFLIKVQGSCLSIFDLSCRSVVVPCVDNLWKHHLCDFAKRRLGLLVCPSDNISPLLLSGEPKLFKNFLLLDKWKTFGLSYYFIDLFYDLQSKNHSGWKSTRKSHFLNFRD